MIALRIEFIAGRFHANPWDSGTNEGDVEWPPAPWRILRAIVAGWFRGGAENRESLLGVLDALAEPPRFLLPRATSGHSRHYVPLGGFKDGKPETAQILDSFLALERDSEHPASAYVVWDRAQLSVGERETLARACGHIGYLGRAESWCLVDVVDAVEVGDLVPVDLASRDESGSRSVRRLSAGASLRGSGLLRSLAESTGEMRKAKRVLPPGTAWAEYRLPPGALLVREQSTARASKAAAFGPTLLRFAVEPPDIGVRPSVTRTVDVADLLRRSTIARYSRIEGVPVSKRLAGKSDDGEGKRLGHDHPYFLPFSSRSDGTIDRIDVWFPKECSHDEYRAVTSVDGLKDRRLFDTAFNVTFLGIVERDVARIWETVTPIALERFPRRRGERFTDSPAEQVERMIRRQFVGEISIDVWQSGSHMRRVGSVGPRLDAFNARRREHGGPNPPLVGATIRFADRISGPIALGRLAHFGLGLLRPIADA